MVNKFVIIILIGLVLIPSVSAADKIKPVEFSLAVTYMGLVIADTALTIYGTSHLGLVETNKLMRPFLEKRQYAALWGIDAIATAGLLIGVHFLIHHDDKAPRIIGYALMTACVIFKGAVVLHNIRLHRKIS